MAVQSNTRAQSLEQYCIEKNRELTQLETQITALNHRPTDRSVLALCNRTIELRGDIHRNYGCNLLLDQKYTINAYCFYVTAQVGIIFEATICLLGASITSQGFHVRKLEDVFPGVAIITTLFFSTIATLYSLNSKLSEAKVDQMEVLQQRMHCVHRALLDTLHTVNRFMTPKFLRGNDPAEQQRGASKYLKKKYTKAGDRRAPTVHARAMQLHMLYICDQTDPFFKRSARVRDISLFGRRILKVPALPKDGALYGALASGALTYSGWIYEVTKVHKVALFCFAICTLILMHNDIEKAQFLEKRSALAKRTIRWVKDTSQ